MIYFVCIFIYLMILAGIGIVKSRQVKSQDDFAVAGRSLSPWVMVCTMLSVWIGTGSIVGNAEKTYQTGMAALILPIGSMCGMILLALIASKARNIEATTVPEIIGRRFGVQARILAVISLTIAYMVIVSYQFNAGGAVIEVITGNKTPVAINNDTSVTGWQLSKGRVVYSSLEDQEQVVQLSFVPADADAEPFTFTVEVLSADKIVSGLAPVKKDNYKRIKQGHYTRIIPKVNLQSGAVYHVVNLPEIGQLNIVEPKITAKTATIIAAIFIVGFTMLAGLKSLASMDILTGSIILLSMLIAVPICLYKAGGFEGMQHAFTAMGDRTEHMKYWGVYSPVQIINFLLPTFLLILGDANMYQRIFASRSAKGAKTAVTFMIFASFFIESMIIACAWIASSMTPDPENGKYILIYMARNYLPLALGCLFMVTVVGIIISTANSFLLVPATTFMKDIYMNHINPKAKEKHIIFLSRLMVVIFGVIAYIVSMAFSKSTGFFEKALFAFTIYGASITPSLVAALVWPKATKAGAITSILSGTAVALLWGQLKLPESISDLDAVLPAILISVLSLVVVSLLTYKPDIQESVAAE
ncbi:MAG: sodium:solute symporter family protein [Phycisphaerae bacterium]|nr:sodium:solute symporter family protein [Phycisphaerae bacterium]